MLLWENSNIDTGRLFEKFDASLLQSKVKSGLSLFPRVLTEKGICTVFSELAFGARIDDLRLRSLFNKQSVSP